MAKYRKLKHIAVGIFFALFTLTIINNLLGAPSRSFEYILSVRGLELLNPLNAFGGMYFALSWGWGSPGVIIGLLIVLVWCAFCIWLAGKLFNRLGK